MTFRRLTSLVPWALLVAAFSAGTAWATARASESQRQTQLDRIEAHVKAIESRVSEMYCAGKPPGCR